MSNGQWADLETCRAPVHHVKKESKQSGSDLLARFMYIGHQVSSGSSGRRDVVDALGEG